MLTAAAVEAEGASLNQTTSCQLELKLEGEVGLQLF